jgi:hypothetical protein
MITTLPAVQYSCIRAARRFHYRAKTKRDNKRSANRRHRRVLNKLVHGFVRDPGLFDTEVFHAPSLSSWDIY